MRGLCPPPTSPPRSLTLSFRLISPFPSASLGLAFVTRLLLRPSVLVVASVRSVPASTPKLAALPRHPSSFLRVVHIDSESRADALQAVEQLKKAGVERVDVVSDLRSSEMQCKR